jgi:hypothetical protein
VNRKCKTHSVCILSVALYSILVCATAATAESSVADELDRLSLLRRSPVINAELENTIADCLNRYGFQYIPRALPDETYLPRDASGKIDQAAFRRQYGFGVTTLGARPTPREDPNIAYLAGLSPSERTQFNSRYEACFQDAQSLLFGQPTVVNSLSHAIQSAYERIDESTTVQREFIAWSRCVKRQGFPHFRQPGDEVKWLFEKVKSVSTPGSAALQGEERKLANLSWSCAQRFLTQRTRLQDRELSRIGTQFPRETSKLKRTVADLEQIKTRNS